LEYKDPETGLHPADPQEREDRAIRDYQELIRRLYISKDSERGPSLTYLCLAEEMGELARAILNNDRENLEEEMADTLAWLFSLANVCQVDLEKAFETKYPMRCIKCQSDPCKCHLRKRGMPDNRPEE